jgi:hypothetical protein
VSWFDYVGVCLGVAISLLASACVLGQGLLGVSSLQACQLSWRFALLQFVLLVAGWLAGIEAVGTMEGWSPSEHFSGLKMQLPWSMTEAPDLVLVWPTFDPCPASTSSGSDPLAHRLVDRRESLGVQIC